MANDVGMNIALPHAHHKAASAFGEEQGRYIIATSAENQMAFEQAANGLGVTITKLGKVGWCALEIRDTGSVKVDALKQAHESWLPEFMS